MAREVATKKGGLTKKEFSIKDWKKKEELDKGVAEKPMDWIEFPEAFQKCAGIPGIPKGYVSIARGFSNTGKSTAIMEAVKACQKKGILPVIIDTESNFNWNHAKEIGIEFEMVEEVNEDTGEIDLVPEGFFVLISCNHLIQKYGRVRDKLRDEAVIEDVALLMNDLLKQQGKGELPYELCFLWDSIGTLDCEQGVTANGRNNQWNAGAMEREFRSILNQKIPLSRKVDREYTNTFLAVNKIWIDSMGAGVVKHKGGESVFFASRVILHFGGQQAHSTKKLSAVSGGREFQFGIQTKFFVEKNHVQGITTKGEIISTSHGFVEATKEGIAAYLKEHKAYLLSKLGVQKTDEELGLKVEEISEGDADYDHQGKK